MQCNVKTSYLDFIIKIKQHSFWAYIGLPTTSKDLLFHGMFTKFEAGLHIVDLYTSEMRSGCMLRNVIIQNYPQLYDEVFYYLLSFNKKDSILLPHKA